MKEPSDPTPYIKYLEDSLCVFGEEFFENFDFYTVSDDLVEKGLDPDFEYIAWMKNYLATHPYEIKVVWGNVSDQ
jgi:hypothetical protein